MHFQLLGIHSIFLIYLLDVLCITCPAQVHCFLLSDISATPVYSMVPFFNIKFAPQQGCLRCYETATRGMKTKGACGAWHALAVASAEKAARTGDALSSKKEAEISMDFLVALCYK